MRDVASGRHQRSRLAVNTAASHRWYWAGVRPASICAVYSSGAVALFDPPWFDAELNALGAAYYTAAGFDVVASMRCALPSDQSAIEPTALFEFVRRHVPAQADAVIFGGNGFRAVGIIDALEHELARPVVSPNQALLWAAMRAAGARTDAITHYGRLFGAHRAATSRIAAPLP